MLDEKRTYFRGIKDTATHTTYKRGSKYSIVHYL